MDNNNDNDVTTLETEIQQLAEELLRSTARNGNQENIATTGRFTGPLRGVVNNLADNQRFGQQEYYSENMRSNFGSFRNNTPNEYNEYMVYLQTLRDIMVMYNSNMSEYNNNVGLSLQVMRSILDERNRSFYAPGWTNPVNGPEINTELPREPVPPASVPSRNNNHLFSYVLYRPTIRAEDGAAMRRFFQNIVVRPTPEQIENATHLIPFQQEVENINTTCPITMEDFQQGEPVRQIKHCRHIFNEQSIQNWFRTNVRCPVCRYDIRDYNAGTGSRPDTTTEPSPLEQMFPLPQSFPTDISQNMFPGYQNLLQQIAENFASDINNILSENIQHDPTRNLVDASQNLIFQLHVETNL